MSRDDAYRARQLELARADLERAQRSLVNAMRRELGSGMGLDSIATIANLALLGCEEALRAWDAEPAAERHGERGHD